nr:hypothetical protein [Tanacetum cinerariifolium]
MYNGQKGIGFENVSYFCKAKDLRPTLYDERVIGLGYTLMFLIHLNEALEIEKFKRARENKKIINPDFEKIDSPFQQMSSLKPAFDCNNARNALCNARMNASVDVNDLFVFDDARIRKSHVSKMLVTNIIKRTKSKQNRAQNEKRVNVKSQQKSTQSKLKTKPRSKNC